MPKGSELVAAKPQRKIPPPPPPPRAVATNFYHNHSLYKYTFKMQPH